MEAKERIKKAYDFLRSKGIVHTQQDVADIMGVKKENISRAFNGNDKYLTTNFIIRFNNAFGNPSAIKFIGKDIIVEIKKNKIISHTLLYLNPKNCIIAPANIAITDTIMRITIIINPHPKISFISLLFFIYCSLSHDYNFINL